MYIVQMHTFGGLTPPKVFTDRVSAETALVDLVREHSAEAYAAYCARCGAEAEAFRPAKAFAETLGAEDSVRYGFWEVSLDSEETSATRTELTPQQRDPIVQAAAETQKQTLAVQTEVRGLMDKLTGLSQELIRLQGLLGAEGEEVAADEIPATAEQSEPMPDALDEKYQTAEWQDFVQSLIRMCGGNWGEFPLLSRQDWRHAVYSNLTALTYWEWVAITIDQAIERAKSRGYAVEEDKEQSGHFAYLTPAGERSETLYEVEDLAWCAAGLHAAQLDEPPA